MAFLRYFALTAFAAPAVALPPFGPGQWPLKSDASEGKEPQTYSIPIDNIPWNGLIHTANITVGTPPQHFNVSIDLESNTFFIPSSECNKWDCIGRNIYYANKSSSYTPDGRSAIADYWSVGYFGHLSQDTVNIGGLEIGNKDFEEYESSAMRTIGGWEEGFDGMLGLAPPWNEDQEHQPYSNFLSLLMKEGKLQENVFSIKYPHKLKEQGELTLGGGNPDLYTGSFRNISFVPPENVAPYFRGAYNLPLNSLTFHTSVPIHLPTPSYIATLTSEPLLILPTDLAHNITKTIGAQPFALMWDYIPCDRRPYLPELSFEIGGENFTIDAFDYTFEWDVGRGFELMCVVWIGEAGDYGLGEGVVGLGTSFLKRWYSRWDLDGRMIGFAELRTLNH